MFCLPPRTHPVRVHSPFPLDLDDAAGLDAAVGGLLLEDPGGGGTAVDAARHRVALHPRGRVHSVPEEAVAGVLEADDVGDARPRVKPHSDLDSAHGGSVLVDLRLICRCHRRDGESGNACSVILGLVLHEVRHRHVRVPYRLHLEDVVLNGELVKARVEPVQHIGDLGGVDRRRNRRETYNVGEENGDNLPAIGLRLPPRDKGLCHVLGEHVEKDGVGPLRRFVLFLDALEGGGGDAGDVEARDDEVQLLERRARGGVARPALLHHLLHRSGAVAGDARGLGHRPVVVQDLLHHLLVVLVIVWLPSACRLEEDDAKGIHVGSLAWCAPLEHLRRHPVWRSDEPEVLLLGEAEVGHFGAEVGVHEDVLRLEVPVQHGYLGRVEEAHALDDVGENREDHLGLQLDGGVVDEIEEGAMRHELHHQHRLPILLHHRPHHRCDARVPQLGEKPHLFHKPIQHRLPIHALEYCSPNSC
mmetsp:Transcript_18978/g.38690  ORF Transcript_18978/g.38690 Transcript_18978/m.38690 type:complete len:473 (-) Transcript_18978:117-1535(-)